MHDSRGRGARTLGMGKRSGEERIQYARLRLAACRARMDGAVRQAGSSPTGVPAAQSCLKILKRMSASRGECSCCTAMFC